MATTTTTTTTGTDISPQAFQPRRNPLRQLSLSISRPLQPITPPSTPLQQQKPVLPFSPPRTSPHSGLHKRRPSSISYSTSPARARSPSARFSLPAQARNLPPSPLVGSDVSPRDSRRVSLDYSSMTLSDGSLQMPRQYIPTPTEMLLHTIAQKEAKCMELRTQLLQEESDLAALKVQWEQTISRPASSRSSSPSPMPPASIRRSNALKGIKGRIQQIWTSGPGWTTADYPRARPYSLSPLFAFK